MKIIICNVCSSSYNSERLLSICEKNLSVEKIFFITPSADCGFVPKSEKIEVITESFSQGINSVLFKVCDSISDGFIGVIPDTFLFSERFLEYIQREINLDNNNLYVLGKENNCILGSDPDNLEAEKYNIYKVFDQSPSYNDFESCLFFDKHTFNLCRDELEKALMLRTNYFVYYFSKICEQQENIRVVYPVNVRLLFSSDVVLNSDKKSDRKIALKLGIIPKLQLSFAQKIFSVVKFNKHTVATVLGLSVPFKIKKQPHFSKSCREISYFTDRQRFNSNRVCIFAGFTALGKISDNAVFYLNSVRKQVDYLVYVADSKADEATIQILKSCCDAVIIKRHNEYDFGSYKRGYELLSKEGILNNADSLLICNDSVDFVGNDADLINLFEKAKDYDAYSLCTSTYGFGNKIKSHKYEWIKAPHLQSYFLILDKKVFLSDSFAAFLRSVTYQKHKTEIIKQYEMGLSEFLKKNNFTMGSYYPYDETNIVNPYAIYLNSYVEHPILVKHMLKK
ncbi:Rhamnan synthesis protein F [Succinivibrio dextrinosolvens]|uniref:rhamnan synthesis F family protein n=1 Tax=Succinivibrio dextrinosolvens TaxID=83771 RepID=UPI0008EC2059|nr:rhamnan synthesis F family protein [Succinivibrio dextrinosolvens]SFS85646.1 Rhamnan synthesis protein F [Succinivibrio dextrinosolvens]